MEQKTFRKEGWGNKVQNSDLPMAYATPGTKERGNVAIGRSRETLKHIIRRKRSYPPDTMKGGERNTGRCRSKTGRGKNPKG